MMSDYKVEMVNDGMSEFYVEFHGPRDSTSLSFQFLCCLRVVVSEVCVVVSEAEAGFAVLGLCTDGVNHLFQNRMCIGRVMVY